MCSYVPLPGCIASGKLDAKLVKMSGLPYLIRGRLYLYILRYCRYLKYSDEQADKVMLKLVEGKGKGKSRRFTRVEEAWPG